MNDIPAGVFELTVRYSEGILGEERWQRDSQD
jgi:hypothetical protein